MLQAFIGLGANLGEPESTLKEAVLRIADIPGIRFVQVSSLYKTEPIDSSGPECRPGGKDGTVSANVADTTFSN